MKTKTSTIAIQRIGDALMAKLIVVFLVTSTIFVITPAALAQGLASLEAGVNYSYVHTNAPPGGCGCFPMNGGSGWAAFNLPHGLAVVGEIGGETASNINHTSADLSLVSYLFGPRYSWHRASRISPFAQLLIGGAHASGDLTPNSTGLSASVNAFAMTAGGGVDIGLSKRFAVRPAQLDYFLTRFNNGTNDHQNNFRYSGGIVFRF